MHHTDYSQNLRHMQRKTIKNLSIIRSAPEEGSWHSKELVRAAVAAVLVVVAMLQMDPANAQALEHDIDHSVTAASSLSDSAVARKTFGELFG